MAGWFYILKDFFMSEASSVADECSQAFKRAAGRYTYMREYWV